MGRVGRIKFGLSPAIISFCLNQLFFLNNHRYASGENKKGKKKEGGREKEREREKKSDGGIKFLNV